MTYIVVDAEADGPAPGLFSMVSFGAVVVDKDLDKTFYGRVKPISDEWIPEALAVSGHSREECLGFEEPLVVMERFTNWLAHNSYGRPIFMSDNLAFDWQWINYYFHRFIGENPFGFSGRRIGDIYCGLRKDMRASGREWKKYRKTKHDHNPVSDALGNAEALLEIGRRYNLKF